MKKCLVLLISLVLTTGCYIKEGDKTNPPTETKIEVEIEKPKTELVTIPIPINPPPVIIHPRPTPPTIVVPQQPPTIIVPHPHHPPRKPQPGFQLDINKDGKGGSGFSLGIEIDK